MTDTATSKTAKPLPHPTADSVPFWKAAAEHRLILQHCNACGATRFPPSPVCPECGSDEATWQDVSGRGRIFSFVTYHRLYHKGWEGELPYTVAIIALEEGPRILSGLVGIAPDKVVCDMPVRVVFEDVAEGVSLPKFTPA